MERLNEEQMEMVDGGTFGSTADDSKALYQAGLMDHMYDGFITMFGWKSISEQVDAAWAKIGVTCVTKPMGTNQYFYEGREISREEAYTLINQKVEKGKFLKGGHGMG